MMQGVCGVGTPARRGVGEWVALLVLWVATLTAIAVSMRINFLYAMSNGEAGEKALLFGVVSVVVDLWKALAPVVIVALWRARRLVLSALATVTWSACMLIALSSAIGLLAHDRLAQTGGRESRREYFNNLTAELKEVEQRRSALGLQRSSDEVEAAIAGVLSRVIVVDDRARTVLGTVEGLSKKCSRVEARTTAACNEIAGLREELVRAGEAAKLEGKAKALRADVQAARGRGDAQEADVQGALLERLTRGLISARDVGMSVVVLIAVLVEVISAVGPLLLAAFGETMRRQTGRVGVVPAARPEVVLEAHKGDRLEARADVAPMPRKPDVLAIHKDDVAVRQAKAVATAVTPLTPATTPTTSPRQVVVVAETRDRAMSETGKAEPRKGNVDPVKLEATPAVEPLQIAPPQSDQVGAPAQFCKEGLQRVGGASVTGKELYAGYVAWCARRGWRPLPLVEFMAEFRRASMAAGIKSDVRDRVLRIVDVRFAT